MTVMSPPTRRELDGLRACLREAWSRDTSSDPEKWSASNPAWGQCAVTALVVQDIFGGELLRATVDGMSHYWNRVRGDEIDLTWEQFDLGAEKLDVAERDRQYVLSFPETVARYRLLRQRIAGNAA